MDPPFPSRDPAKGGRPIADTAERRAHDMMKLRAMIERVSITNRLTRKERRARMGGLLREYRELERLGYGVDEPVDVPLSDIAR